MPSPSVTGPTPAGPPPATDQPATDQPATDQPATDQPVGAQPVSASGTSVEALMARMAGGDAAAVFDLVEHHGHRVAGEVRRQLRICGVDTVDRHELDGLVLDAAMTLFEVASSWRPGGALPWTWAKDRIRGDVRRWVGVHADALHHDGPNEPAHDERASPLDEAVEATFARLVDEVPVVGLVAQACAAARVDEPALFCLLEYRIQQDAGDPSPAHTLADRYGVTPDALRQRISRSTRRLRAVVESEPRYAPLSTFTLVA